jgi:mRNA interferase MazF
VADSTIPIAILCPVTSHAKGYPFEVALPDGAGVEGVMLADQVKSLDWRARQAQLIDRMPNAVTGEVLGKLGVLLG